MISRRAVIYATGAAAAALGGISARPANAAVSALPQLGKLAETPASASPAFIAGQGWFETALAEGEADGILRIAGADGQHWLRSNFAGALHPAWFAETADGPDDALRIQRAIDHAVHYGPFAIELGAARYNCLTRLVIDPTRIALQGAGAVLDFSAMQEPAQEPPVATLDDLAADVGWRREDGTFLRDEGEETSLIHELPLPLEGRYRVSLVVEALSGNSDFPALKVSLGEPKDTASGSITVTAPGQYDFEVEGPLPSARLTLGTDAAVRIKSLTVEAQGIRECMLIAADGSSAQYGHKWMTGIEVKGPGTGTALHGLRFETLADSRSSRYDLRDVTVRGFQTGFVFSHRSYLIRFTSLRCACDVGFHFLGGLSDAGELITLNGCVIDGGRIAVLNNDAEVAMFGTAIDFVDQVLVGAGRLTLHGCHLEVNRPKAADKPLFDLGRGTVSLEGGSFMVTGSGFEQGNLCDHIFELRSRGAVASMRNVSIYNLRSQSGALAGGPGRLDTALMRGSRPRHMAPIVQFDSARNLLGPLPHDLRVSATATGEFARFPTATDSFKVSPTHRYIWLFGRAPAGVELGLSLRLRSDTPGRVQVILQAFNGDVRAHIGDSWPVDVTKDWQKYTNNTANTHPASALDGRVPAGYGEVAMMLDLSALEGTIEIEDCFLCSV